MPRATHAEPPFGTLQWSPSDFVEHFVTPLALVRQQVTNPDLPQVDLAAHFTTAPLQLGFVSCSAVFAAPAAQLTYWPWFVKLSHGQFNFTCRRASATAAASAPVTSHFAALRCAVSASSDSAMAVTKKPRILGRIGHLPFGSIVRPCMSPPREPSIRILHFPRAESARRDLLLTAGRAAGREVGSEHRGDS